MNMAVRLFFQNTPVLRELYNAARAKYNRRRMVKSAQRYIRNVDQYRKALEKEDGQVVDLYMSDGITLTVRRNVMDAAILAEIFFDNCYTRGLTLPDAPIVVDIGGYIGDFAVYAAKRLNARKVVVCEPSPRNWVLLERNVANNDCQERIQAVNKAVTDGQPVMMNVNAPDRAQARVSAYGGDGLAKQSVPGVSLSNLVDSYGLSVIDLLKIDCEGGEYTILSTAPTGVFNRIKNIVFECHEIDGFKAMLDAVKRRLADEGFSLRTQGSLIFATRIGLVSQGHE